MVKRMWRKMRDIGDTSLFGTHYATLRTAPIGPESVGETWRAGPCLGQLLLLLPG